MQRIILIIAVATTIVACATLALAVSARSSSSPQPCGDTCAMPGMGSGMNSGSDDMGPHMRMTPLATVEPGDRERAAAIVASLVPAIEKYRDYRVAEQNGYVPFHPEIPMPVYHFTNSWNAIAAQFSFDPTRPTSLLYRRTADGYVLIGAMYTAPRSATPAQLNARVPLSIARWHEHVDFCIGPWGSTRADYIGPNARFGLKGSIATAQACAAAGGRFVPIVFGWMVHVYPFETDPADVWKVTM